MNANITVAESADKGETTQSFSLLCMSDYVKV